MYADLMLRSARYYMKLLMNQYENFFHIVEMPPYVKSKLGFCIPFNSQGHSGTGPQDYNL